MATCLKQMSESLHFRALLSLTRVVERRASIRLSLYLFLCNVSHSASVWRSVSDLPHALKNVLSVGRCPRGASNYLRFGVPGLWNDAFV